MFTHHHNHAAARPANAGAGTSINYLLPLIAMGLGVIILAQDFSSVNVALPAIERDLNSDLSTVQWVINAYALVFGMLIVAGGRFADMFGRRRVFFVGAAIFAGLSLIGGFAPNVMSLIAARAVMGIGGALMWPAILGMTYSILPKDKAGLAGGLIIGAAGVGQAAGPILGGALTELLGWRWTLFINIPIAAFAIIVTYARVHLDEKTTRAKIDYPGIATMSLGVLALLFALDQGTEWGWTDPRILTSLALAVVLLAAFAWIELRAGGEALVPRDIMSNRQFAATCVSMALLSPTMVASLLYLPQLMQKLSGFSPFQSGLGMLPMLALFAALSFVGGTLYNRLGARIMVVVGASALVLGPFLLSLVVRDGSYTELVVGMVVIGLGLGLYFSSITTAGISAVESSRTSLAGGLIYMFQIVGAAIGLGLTTTVVTLTSHLEMNAELARLARPLTDAQLTVLDGILAGTESAKQAAAQVGGAAVEQIVRIANNAFAAGLQNGFRLDAALALIGFLVVLTFVGTAARASSLINKSASEK